MGREDRDIRQLLPRLRCASGMHTEHAQQLQQSAAPIYDTRDIRDGNDGPSDSGYLGLEFDNVAS